MTKTKIVSSILERITHSATSTTSTCDGITNMTAHTAPAGGTSSNNSDNMITRDDVKDQKETNHKQDDDNKGNINNIMKNINHSINDYSDNLNDDINHNSYNSVGASNSGNESSNAAGAASAAAGGPTSSTFTIISGSSKLCLLLYKYFFLLSLLIAGTIVAVVTYTVLEQQESGNTDQAYTAVANTIEESLRFQIHNIFEANRFLARTITSSAYSNKEIFPLVNVQGFESYGSIGRMKGRLSEIMYAPVVYDAPSWLNYSGMHSNWYLESLEIYNKLQTNSSKEYDYNTYTKYYNQKNPANNGQGLYVFDRITQSFTIVTEKSVAYPSFHTSPPPPMDAIAFQNIDLNSVPAFRKISIAAVALNDAVFSQFGASLSVTNGEVVNDKLSSNGRPESIAAQPVYAKLAASSKDIVGYVFSIVQWEKFIKNLLPDGVRGIQLIFGNNCDQNITYALNGNETTFVAIGDVHDTKYNPSRRTVTFDENYLRSASIVSEIAGHCRILVDLYPTQVFVDDNSSNIPVIITSIIAGLFLVMAIVFLVYDKSVENRNKKISIMANRSTALVETLFPKNVAHRLLEDAQNDELNNNNGNPNNSHLGNRKTLRGFLNGDKYDDKDDNEHDGEVYKTQPIADLFLACTVLFSDIAGFTAWSSVREPPMVFILLETIYGAYDRIARKRGVFKVETIGDCYVAVCGVPVQRKDHAVVMARFSFDCMVQVLQITKQLESTLGPDTGDLSMRMGLHSGPVTGGVLRGEKARFQLFGETMNMAACIENTGQKNRIHISLETADLLIEAGKMSWLKPREDVVQTRAKGTINTFWLDIDRNKASSIQLDTLEDANTEYVDSEVLKVNEVNGKTMRLVSWNKEVLHKLLIQIVQRRHRKNKNRKIRNPTNIVPEQVVSDNGKKSVIDEVQEIIEMPQIDPKLDNEEGLSSIKVDLGKKVTDQLEMFVSEIAMLYRDNPFHNFEHASHVTMSVSKLLARIVAPSEIDFALMSTSEDSYSLHDHTYGITSDPLTQFACVLSALIHDLDHPGVPNAQLIKEQTPVALQYNNRSVAEQNSVDIAWGVLLSDKFSDLRQTIYSNETEKNRFRQLVVNSVMATDIMDKDLKDLRNARWDRAFKTDMTQSIRESPQAFVNRKATIVIEHLIQASDVAHTMQHWHVYRKWNEMFFEECYQAYANGRAETDPSINWYKGEMGFYDFYIIPLAKKLKECGVFGVSSDEYLGYAMKNRAEWEDRGEEIVSEMVERVRSKFGTPTPGTLVSI